MTAAAQANTPNHQQLDHFAKDVQAIIVDAQNLADEQKHKEILPIHMLSSSMKNDSIIKTFKELNLPQKEILSKIEIILSNLSLAKEDEAYLSLSLEKFFSLLEKDSSISDLVHIEKFFTLLVSKSYKQNLNIFQQCGIDTVIFCEKLKEVRRNGFAQISKTRLLDMEAEIGKRVIGQREAINAVSRVVRRGFVGLNDPGKPIGSMLFLGSSGTGKTEVAKALAEFLFGSDKKSFLRFDMSEFSERHTVARLIGSPNGYIGSEDGGQLTNAVRDNPNQVILLDEIEKAHGDLFNIFLSLLDDGRLSSGKGQLIDFSNTIIIMTSNIGSKRILDHLAERKDSNQTDENEAKEALREMLHGELLKFLRPEFLNRIGDKIIFDPLNKMEIDQITEIQLRALANRLAEREMKISFDQQAKNAISELGFDPSYGARPLKRVILRYIKDPLCLKILDGTYDIGSHIQVSHDGEHFQLN